MNHKILLTAVLAALATSGCQKQADAPAEPVAAPAPVQGPAGPAGPQGPPGATRYAPPPAGVARNNSYAQPHYVSGSHYIDEPALPAADIGVEVNAYPDLQPVPGYPVYYAPGMRSNYFFYDGAYWVYNRDNWYASTWYNGPWARVGPEEVPVFILRVPVRYYREPPAYFRGWRDDDAPRWSVQWGNDWERRRDGWDNWDHRSPPPAPLPVYQRQYSGIRYPVMQEQQTLHTQNYHYQAKDEVVQRVVQAQAAQAQNPQRSTGRPGDRPPMPGQPAPQGQRPAMSGENGRPGQPPQTPPQRDQQQRDQQQREMQQREQLQRDQQQGQGQRPGQPAQTQVSQPTAPPAVQPAKPPVMPQRSDPPRRENEPQAKPPEPEHREPPRPPQAQPPMPPREAPPPRTSPERPQPPKEGQKKEEEHK